MIREVSGDILLTQEPAPGRHSHPGKATLPHVNHALRKLHGLVTEHGLTSLALPKLATGVGGLDWTDVAVLVHQHLDELEVPVWVYTTYVKGHAAEG